MPRPGANASSDALCSVASVAAETLSEESIDQLIEAAHETPEPVDKDNIDLNTVDTKDESAQ